MPLPQTPPQKNSPCLLPPYPPCLRRRLFRRLSRRPFPKKTILVPRPPKPRAAFFGVARGRGRMYKHARRPGAPVARPAGGALYGEKLV